MDVPTAVVIIAGIIVIGIIAETSLSLFYGAHAQTPNPVQYPNSSANAIVQVNPNASAKSTAPVSTATTAISTTTMVLVTVPQNTNASSTPTTSTSQTSALSTSSSSTTTAAPTTVMNAQELVPAQLADQDFGGSWEFKNQTNTTQYLPDGAMWYITENLAESDGNVLTISLESMQDYADATSLYNNDSATWRNVSYQEYLNFTPAAFPDSFSAFMVNGTTIGYSPGNAQG